ncbi:hypothetical protein, partial [Metamycoplasma equirhinis]
NLFSNNSETKAKYMNVYQKYFDEVIDANKHTDILDGSLYNQIWFSTNPTYLNINYFNQHYLRFTNELIEEMNKINLDQFVKEFIITIKLQDVTNKNKFPSELLKNKSLFEIEKLFRLEFKTSKSSSQTSEIDLDKLKDKDHLLSKLSKIEEGIQIYKDFTFNIELPTFDDIEGLVYIKISGKTTVNSKILNTEKIISCYNVFKKYSGLGVPQNYNGHSIVNDESIFTIDDLLQRMKTASKTIANNKFGDFVEFSGQNPNNLKAIVDENSIKKHDSKKIEFIVKFIKENVAYVDADKSQKYKDYEIGHKKYAIDFGEAIKNNRKKWLENNQLQFVYKYESEKAKRKASEAYSNYFELETNKNPSWITYVSNNGYTNPNDVDGTVSLWYSEIYFNDGIESIKLTPKESNRISGFKPYSLTIERPKYRFELNDSVGGFSYIEHWGYFLRFGFLHEEFLLNFNSKDINRKREIFNRFFRVINYIDLSNADISYNQGEASFNVKYSMTNNVIISRDANGNESTQSKTEHFTDNPSFKEIALTIRRMRTFNNYSSNYLSNVISGHYYGGKGKEFQELYNIANTDQRNEIYRLQNWLWYAGGHNFKEIFNVNNAVTKENIDNIELQQKIKQQYDALMVPVKKLFDSFGTRGQQILAQILKIYDNTYDGEIGDF